MLLKKNGLRSTNKKLKKSSNLERRKRFRRICKNKYVGYKESEMVLN